MLVGSQAKRLPSWGGGMVSKPDLHLIILTTHVSNADYAHVFLRTLCEGPYSVDDGESFTARPPIALYLADTFMQDVDGYGLTSSARAI